MEQEDVEMIDVESNESTTKGIKRKPNESPQKRTQFGSPKKTSLLNSTKTTFHIPKLALDSPRKVQTAKRTVLAAKRIIKHAKHQDKDKQIFVIDTNILLSHLNSLKNLLVHFRGRKDIQFLIPWVVLEELEYRKELTKFEDKNMAFKAIHFINEQLDLNDSLLIKENPIEDSVVEQMTKLIEQRINDDKIINCCIKICDKCKNVVLVSNDINLLNKAKQLKRNFHAFNWNDFNENYGIKIDGDKESDDEMIEEPKKKRKTRQNSLTKPFDFTNSSFSYTFSDEPMQMPFTAQTKPHVINPQVIKSHEINEINEQQIKSKDNLNSNMIQTNVPQDNTEWIHYKYECEKKLLKFLQYAHWQLWKDDPDERIRDAMMFGSIDPEKSTLKDMIRVLKTNWAKCLSDFFNRNSEMKVHIDELHQKLSRNQKYNTFIEHLNYIIDQVDQVMIKNS